MEAKRVKFVLPVPGQIRLAVILFPKRQIRLVVPRPVGTERVEHVTARSRALRPALKPVRPQPLLACRQ